MTDDPDADSGSFPAKLRRLFDSVPNAQGTRMAVREVCLAAHDSGHEISEAYLYQLLQGRKDNPSYATILAIASGFGVPATYFFDDEMRVRVDQQIELLRLVADTPVKQIYFRLMDLDGDNLQDVLDYARYVRHRQGLPPLDDLPASPPSTSG